MSIIKNPVVKILVAPAAIFNAEIETEKVLMDNFQTAHFVIASGSGMISAVSAQVIATNENGDSEKIIAEVEINIGAEAENKIVVDADKLAHDNLDRVYLKAANAGNSQVVGGVFVVLTNERYND